MKAIASDLTVLPPTRLLIGGEWGEGARNKRFATIDPATENVIAEVSEATGADIDAAVGAARTALKRGPWPAMAGAQRGRILNRVAAIMRERIDDLVLLESVDGGKPLAATRRMDVPAAIDCFEYYAGWADKISGEMVPARRDALTYVMRVPVGVVAVIVPWNFALMNAVWKIAPALACGCTIVLKPAELTPLSALWLGAVALEAGLPPGVLNIVPGYGADAGAALVSHSGIDKISFTGSPQTGQFIMRAAAENITRIGLELGGKSPSVIFADANLDAALRQTASGAFFNAGQVCSAATRVIVDRAVHDPFVEKLAARARSLRIGNPLEDGVNLGPVISQKQMTRVLDYIGVGKEEARQLSLAANGMATAVTSCSRRFSPASAETCGWRAKRFSVRLLRWFRFPTKTKRSVLPMARTTVWQPRSGLRTSTAHSVCRIALMQARCGSTPMVRPMRGCRGAAWAASPVLAAISAALRSTITPSRKQSGYSSQADWRAA